MLYGALVPASCEHCGTTRGERARRQRSMLSRYALPFMMPLVSALMLTACRADRAPEHAADSTGSIAVDSGNALGTSSSRDSATASVNTSRDSASVASDATPPSGAEPAKAPAVALPASDTVRGIVSETGAEPVTALLLVPVGAGERVALSGPATSLLRRVVGLDVMVRGTLTDQRAPVTPGGARVFSASQFTVRAADGVEAYDGVVTLDGQQYGLRTADGKTHPAPHLPEALRAKRGARVFLAGSLGSAPVAYGIISEAR